MQQTETPAATPGPSTPNEGLTPPPELGVPAEPLAETPAQGQEGAEEGQEPITSWEGLEKAEWFPAAYEEKKATFIEEAKPEILKEAKREAYREFDPHIQRQEATLNNLLQQGQKALRQMGQMVEDQAWDKRSAENWAADHQDFINGLNGAYWGAGVQRTLGQLAEAAGDRHLASDMHIRLASILQGQQDPAFMTDFVDRLSEGKVKEAVKAAEEKGRQKGLREAQGAQAELAATKQRGKEGANLAPGSPAGGKSDKELLLDPTTPIETIKEIQARQ